MAKEKNSRSTRPSGKSAKGRADSDDTTFEQALEQLENLVESMENDQAPLDQLIDNYEKGTLLYKLCQQRLGDAQQRVDLIRGESEESKGLETFDGEIESAERTEKLETNTHTDDGELF